MTSRSRRRKPPRQPQSAGVGRLRRDPLRRDRRHIAGSLPNTFGRLSSRWWRYLLVTRAVGQADVKGTPRLPHRVIQLLMHREGEHARIGFEDERRPVSMMDVQVDDGEALQSGCLQKADRDCHIVEEGRTFAMIRKRVMEAAPDMADNPRVRPIPPFADLVARRLRIAIEAAAPLLRPLRSRRSSCGILPRSRPTTAARESPAPQG